MPCFRTHGLLCVEEYDFQFVVPFHNGTWPEGLPQEDILQNVKCPCTYIKASSRSVPPWRNTSATGTPLPPPESGRTAR